jgi:hypothetical protein
MTTLQSAGNMVHVRSVGVRSDELEAWNVDAWAYQKRGKMPTCQVRIKCLPIPLGRTKC